MIRKLVLALALTGAGSASAQEVVRPIARPASPPLDSVEVSKAPIDALGAMRPQARQVSPAETPDLAPPVAEPITQLGPVVRPYLRPDLARGNATTPILRAEQNLFAFSPTALVTSIRPTTRTELFIQAMADRQAAIQRGQVCGDPAIQGTAVGDVPGRGQCGISNAVRIKSVAGVLVRPEATLDCRTAQALKRWVTTGVQPATGGQAISLRNVSDYACRNRNSAASGRLSEHAFGRAIDIAGIGLKDGREITVLTGWNSGRDGEALRRMWQAACGPFGTVLGPNANRFHRDHFHFDTANYRSGSYCR